YVSPSCRLPHRKAMSRSASVSMSGLVTRMASPANSVRFESGSTLDVNIRTEAVGKERATSCSLIPLAVRVVASNRATRARRRNGATSTVAITASGGGGPRLLAAGGTQARQKAREQVGEAQEQTDL